MATCTFIGGKMRDSDKSSCIYTFLSQCGWRWVRSDYEEVVWRWYFHVIIIPLLPILKSQTLLTQSTVKSGNLYPIHMFITLWLNTSIKITTTARKDVITSFGSIFLDFYYFYLTLQADIHFVSILFQGDFAATWFSRNFCSLR